MRLAVCWLVVLAACCRCAAAQDEQADADAIRAAAIRTQERRETEWAAWTTRCVFDAGPVIAVDVVESPTARRWTVRSDGVASVTFVDVIERDESWYVSEGGRHVRYRPFEANFQHGFIPLMRELSTLKLATEATTEVLGKMVALDGAVATFRPPLPAHVRQQFEGMLAAGEAIGAEDPAAADRMRADPRVQAVKALLADPPLQMIDIRTGILVDHAGNKMRVKNERFRWLIEKPDDAFAVADRQWVDRTAPIAADGLGDEWVMMLHHAAWPGGRAATDPDARLLNLESDEVRRVPFVGPASLPGCFLRERGSVAVCGADPIAGTFALYEINLETGENRAIGGEHHLGVAAGMALSPDQRIIAVAQTDLSRGPMHKQIVLIDVESGDGRAIGEPLDAVAVNWAPNGQSLVMVRMDHIAANKPAIHTLVRMRLEGQVRSIRRGSWPMVLPDGRIVFRDDGDGETWKICNADGGDVRPLSRDPLPRLGFPALSPDAKRILFIRFDPSPRPVVFDLGSGQLTPATKVEGFWGSPAWR